MGESFNKRVGLSTSSAGRYTCDFYGFRKAQETEDSRAIQEAPPPIALAKGMMLKRRVAYASALEKIAKIPEDSKEGPPIVGEWKVYRPGLKSAYFEKEYLPDSADTLDVLFKDHRNAVWRNKTDLPPRAKEDIIQFLGGDEAELEQNLV